MHPGRKPGGIWIKLACRAADFAVQLDDDWTIATLEVRPRTNNPGSSSQFTHDTVLRARRHP